MKPLQFPVTMFSLHTMSSQTSGSGLKVMTVGEDGPTRSQRLTMLTLVL